MVLRNSLWHKKMTVSSPKTFGEQAPLVPGYALSERCWEDAISITFRGRRLTDNHPAFVRVAKMRRVATPLRRDFDVCSRSNVKSILKPLDFFRIEGIECLILPDHGARPLTEHLLHRRLPFANSLLLIWEIVQAIREVHQDSIVHGNLGPHSIWANNDLREIRIADLSRAVFRSDVSPERQVHADFHYIAPEQTGRIDRIIDARSDLYSAGALAYFLVCGRPPFEAVTPLELIQAHLDRLPKPPHNIEPGIPLPISRIIMKLLAKEPEERYQTVAGLGSDLQFCLSEWQARSTIPSFPIGQGDVPAVFQITNKLYGRNAELTTLQDSLRRTSGGATEFTVVCGPPGVGKSLLIQSIQSTTSFTGAFISGKFDQFKSNEPYSVIAQAFRVLIEQLLCCSQLKLQEWRKRIIDALGANLYLIVGVIPELEELIDQPLSFEIPATEKRHRFNHAFRQFVRVFANVEHPLCLFLDDLQWADPASLTLIHTLLTDSEVTHFSVIGTLRLGDDADGAVTAIIEQISESNIPTTRILLSALEEGDIGELLRDALRCSPTEAAPFAELIKTKTDGNPFFITQFLSFLNHQKLIVFDFAQSRWAWDLRKIAAEGVTDNVLELMNRRVRSLPSEAQEAAKIAACIGSRFTAQALSMILDTPLPCALRALRILEREGLVLALIEDDQAFEFKFLHDRVQQAAYSLIPELEQPAMRLKIGRSLLAGVPQTGRDAGDFAILDNLNAASHLIEDRNERNYIARLNATAGKRAREIAAFDAAHGYYKSGMDLLPRNAWDKHYDLALELHLGRFECAYFVGRVEEANDLFAHITGHSLRDTDTARAYYLKILLDTGIDRSDEAVSVGLKALSLFGEALPPRPNKLQLFRALAAVIIRLHGRRAKYLLELPTMSDPAKKDIVTLLMSICPAAYFRNPDLMVFAALRIVEISLRYGNAPASSFGYALYGLARGALFGDYKTGHEFGCLAVDLSKLTADPTHQCKILTIFAGWLNFWRRPIDDTVDLLTSSLKLALEAGDVQYAHYSALQIIFMRFARGANLDVLMREMNNYRPVIEQAADWFTQTTYSVKKQQILALQGLTASWGSLEDTNFRETPRVSEMRTAGNLTALTYYLVAKEQLTYLFGSFAEARQYSDEAETQIKTVVNQIAVSEHYFYRGLIYAALIRRDIRDANVLWRNLKECGAKLRCFAEHCPQNFATHAFILQAETALLNGNRETAGDLFDAAVKSAHEQSFHQIEAIANELAGEGWLARNRPVVAKAYLTAARSSYKRWGASGKVEQLSSKHAYLFEEQDVAPIASGERSAQQSAAEKLDLDGVMRATIDVAADVEADRLLNKLMRLILECTNGQRVFIISETKGDLHVELAASNDGAQVLLHPASNDHSQFSESAINYVLHTGRQLVLNDARTDPRFKNCSYIAMKRPRSIACVPLFKMGSVLGVAYVENGSIPDAFSADKVRAMALLSRQVVSALEAMHLERQLNQSSNDLKAALQNVELLSGIRDHLAKFVPYSLQKLIEENPENPDLVGREEDVSILFLDIAGSTSMSEQLGSEELKQIIETYFSSFIGDIRKNGGDINEVAGDGLMIIFQDPDVLNHARMATRTALSIREKTEQLNVSSHGRWPPIVINIGIHSGLSLIGANKIESSANTRWVYTATGYVANVAARIGSAASNGAILVSEATAARLGSEFELIERGAPRFKGVSHPINIFSVSGRRMD
ncbi:AAA family ATPase [Bradyrhizobium sp. WSM1417]|uniref:AAA family ATPase n=1 Tax=Bradyrhizobium sp. WSM1417 TaxID=754500 RepID=UPI0018DE4FD4|nr:AAA family ATPase [Bradyrhizobium sp. WSM1417]